MMKKSLNFICPTDCLEAVINDAFIQENYYYSSLGNSVLFDSKIVREIKKMVNKKNIKEISFVLSNNNRIVLDAIGEQDFLAIRGLEKFYKQITLQRKQLCLSWQVWDHSSLLISYHLNKKIKELKRCSDDLFMDQLSVNGKIYNRQEDLFTAIYPDLICKEYASLN